MENKPSIKIVGPNLGFWGILGLIFITLKLCKVIDWSWWLVLLPLYLPLGLFVVIAMLVVTLVWAMSSMEPRTFGRIRVEKTR